MKNLITALLLLCFHGRTFSQKTSLKINCSEDTKYVKLIGGGMILHTTCKENELNYFFFINNQSDTVGELLNRDYDILGKKMKITSSGPDFFVVRKNKQSGKYQYTFGTKSWYFDKPKRQGWSTGNREDP